MSRNTTIVLVLALVLIAQVEAIKLWPLPKQITNGTDILPFSVCDFNAALTQNNLTSAMRTKIQFYAQKIFQTKDSVQCNLRASDFSFTIKVNNTDIKFGEFGKDDESYTLEATANKTISINANTYFGFLRALETLSQLLRQNPDEVSLPYLPIQIQDSPSYGYRGVMIDSARNYLKKSSILRTIDAMMYNKMNVLHWHITDDESFPIELESIPEMSDFGSYGARYRYSKSDVQEIVDYAAQSGVRVIPEVDSPGHVRSWGRSAKYSNITIACPGGEHYNNQLDPTLDLTYEANDLIFKDIQNLFQDQYVHMGGDEVFGSCWDQRPSIKQFMAKNNISDYNQLQVYYRNRQKKSIQANRTKIYWANEVQHIPPAPEDIIQFWGQSYTYNVIQNLPNKVILSPEDFLYINSGINFIWGNFFGNFTTWLNIYQVNISPVEIERSRILGAETTLWGEVNTDSTLDVYLWVRSSALAERLWTGNHSTPSTSNINMSDLARRLSFMEDLMIERGINAAPVTNKFCKENIGICFDWRSASVYQSTASAQKNIQ
ncbi:hypothetical protein ABPG74_016832 [Tetrahymena malaccensis]